MSKRQRGAAPPAAPSEPADGVLSVAAWRRHLIWFVAATFAGAGALFFNFAEQVGGRFHGALMARSPYLAAGLVAVSLLVICLLRDRFFRGTEGTGIPQVIAALKIPDGPERERVLSGRILIGKMLLLTLGLLSGLTIGREGPSVHVGACALHLSSRLVRFPRHLAERGLILAGGAAGIAAAFNAPIAGALFAFEEIGRSFEKENAGTILRTALWASMVCAAVLGSYLFYGRIEARIETLEQWLAVAVIGVLGGVLGGSFAQAVLWGSRRLRPLYQARPALVAGALGLALGGFGLLSQGLSYGSGYAEAERLLIGGEDLPAFFAPLIAAANFVTLLSGVPGGLFDPSLTTGAALGQMALPFSPFPDRQAFLLLCMVAYFTGVVQSPLTATAILIEMTGATRFAMPVLLAAVLAYEASRWVCPTALYEGLAESFLAQLRGERRDEPARDAVRPEGPQPRPGDADRR